MSHQDFRTTQNSSYPRCVDGRVAEIFIEFKDGQWHVIKRGGEAAGENGPQFLGGSLLFVKALEELAGKTREEAFDLVEKASEKMEWGTQVHLDDAHGEHNFQELSDDDVIQLMGSHHSGCGFAKYAWGENADAIIQEAKTRHWRLQLLTGEHQEHGATVNMVEGQTFDTGAAVAVDKSQFNTDLRDAELMFETLAKMIGDKEFAAKATAWTKSTYEDVVVALKGVGSADEIEVIE